MNRAALLIGNAEYDPLPGLRTPVSDVRELSDRLEAVGFSTMVVENANLKKMNSSISEFASKIARMPPGGSVLFYFAGHGAQYQGENYLMPVDAGILNEEWRRGSWTLSSLLQDLCWQSNQQKLIVLDACRTNGIPSISRTGALGLSGVSTANYETVHETTILYAARPGQVALDGSAIGSSPLCRAMLDALSLAPSPLVTLVPRIALKVDEYTAGQQDPWSTSNMKRMAEKPFWDAGEATSPLPIAGQLSGGATAKPVQFASSEDEIVGKKGHLIHRLKAKDTTGKWAYYFVLVEPENEERFMRAINSGAGTIDMEDFGSVVASCYGEEPTSEIRTYLKDRYGFDV